jgi:predicted signal transduction protein with EAL and GGDEF domain
VGGSFPRASRGSKCNERETGGDIFIFGQTMTDTVARRPCLENKLRQALEQNQLVLSYQPNVNLRTGTIMSSLGSKDH